jgi:hypothetical protein
MSYSPSDSLVLNISVDEAKAAYRILSGRPYLDDGAEASLFAKLEAALFERLSIEEMDALRRGGR